MEINTGVEIKSPLESIVDILEYQKSIKRDIVVPSEMIRYDALSGMLQASSFDYALTDHSHLQIANKLEIPINYYKKCSPIPQNC